MDIVLKQYFPISLNEMIASFWRNRSLILVIIKREVVGRYRGSILEIIWSFFHPLFMLAVFTFVFSAIFKAQWSGGSGSKSDG